MFGCHGLRSVLHYDLQLMGMSRAGLVTAMLSCPVRSTSDQCEVAVCVVSCLINVPWIPFKIRIMTAQCGQCEMDAKITLSLCCLINVPDFRR